MKNLLRILFVLFTLNCSAQTFVPTALAPTITHVPYPFDTRATVMVPNESYFIIRQVDATPLAYWGQKGIECKDLVPSLYRELNLRIDRIGLLDNVVDNCRQAKEQYQEMLAAAVAQNKNTESDLLIARAKAEEWKTKARKRGELLWSIGAAGAAVVAGVIFLP